MRWVAGLVVAVMAVVLLNVTRGPDVDCVGGTTPGGLVDEADPGEATADAAVSGFLDGADHYTAESSSQRGLAAVTYRVYDAEDRLRYVVEAEHRQPKGWFVGRTTTCQ